MQRRALFSLVNVGVAAATLLVFFLYPRYAGYAIYAFLGWFIVSLATLGFARGSSSVAGPSPVGPVPTAAAAPGGAAVTRRPSAGVATAPAEVGFCIYCAEDLPAGVDRCPACGHAGARLA